MAGPQEVALANFEARVVSMVAQKIVAILGSSQKSTRNVRAAVVAATLTVVEDTPGCASAETLFQWAFDHLVRNEIAARPSKGVIQLSPTARQTLASGKMLIVPPFRGHKRPPRRNWKQITSQQAASRPLLNPAATLERLLSGMTEKAPDQLLAIWKNAVTILADPKRRDWHPAAQGAIEKIDAEWSRRVESHDEKWFQWPTTDAKGGSGRLSMDGAPEEGLLAFMGYRVGVTKGEPTPIRQSILDRVFLGTLPPVVDPAYTASWGPAGTAMRLKRIADARPQVGVLLRSLGVYSNRSVDSVCGRFRSVMNQ